MDEQGETPQKKGLAGEEGWRHNTASHTVILCSQEVCDADEGSKHLPLPNTIL